MEVSTTWLRLATFVQNWQISQKEVQHRLCFPVKDYASCLLLHIQIEYIHNMYISLYDVKWCSYEASI